MHGLDREAVWQNVREDIELPKPPNPRHKVYSAQVRRAVAGWEMQSGDGDISCGCCHGSLFGLHRSFILCRKPGQARTIFTAYEIHRLAVVSGTVGTVPQHDSEF